MKGKFHNSDSSIFRAEKVIFVLIIPLDGIEMISQNLSILRAILHLVANLKQSSKQA